MGQISFPSRWSSFFHVINKTDASFFNWTRKSGNNFVSYLFWNSSKLLSRRRVKTSVGLHHLAPVWNSFCSDWFVTKLATNSDVTMYTEHARTRLRSPVKRCLKFDLVNGTNPLARLGFLISVFRSHGTEPNVRRMATGQSMVSVQRISCSFCV